MLINEINSLLYRTGFTKVVLNRTDFQLYIIEKSSPCYCVLLWNFSENSCSAADYQKIVAAIKAALSKNSFDGINILTIIITDNADAARNAISSVDNCWVIDTFNKRLMVFDNSSEDFCGLRRSAEKIAAGDNADNRNTRNFSLVNTIIVAANILVFAYMEKIGNTEDTDFLLAHGALYRKYFLSGQYYRIFTYMFMHSGFSHIFNNMLVLYFIGDSLERVIGRYRYLILYIFSGLIAGAVSMAVNAVNGVDYVSVGASGAIFGVIGAMVYILIINRGRLDDMKLSNLLIFIGLSIYGGMTTLNIDNAAHVGGLVGGFLLAVILYKKKMKISVA